MHITISGTPGSGKGTVSRKLGRWLGYRVIDAGGLRRVEAKRRGMTLEEYNQLGERDPSTDRSVDWLQRRLGRSRRPIIFDGYTSFYFVPRSIKIFLDVQPHVAALRIWRELQRGSARDEGRRVATVAQVERTIRARTRSDRKRYRKYYGFDHHDRKHYDFYLDTSRLTRPQVYRRVKQFLVDKLAEENVLTRRRRSRKR